MAENTSTPQRKQKRKPRRPGHDELFKAFFGQQPMVQSFLETFVRLPFVDRLKPGTWKRLPCEFVDEEQRKTLGDIPGRHV